VQRFRPGFSVIPPARRVGLEYDLDHKQGLALARAMGWLMAAELRAFGIDFSFAPCVDLDFGVSEIIGDRAYHANAETVARLSIAVMQGMRQAGMAAIAKHFGHGAVVADSAPGAAGGSTRPADLAADMLIAASSQTTAAVMMGHVLLRWIPCPREFLPALVGDILRAGSWISAALSLPMT
jgi:beta-N-acetylhexosaminidase